MAEVLHDTIAHVFAGGFGIPAEDCPRCELEQQQSVTLSEGECEALGHPWRLTWQPTAKSKAAAAYYCPRCHKNGWKI